MDFSPFFLNIAMMMAFFRSLGTLSWCHNQVEEVLLQVFTTVLVNLGRNFIWTGRFVGLELFDSFQKFHKRRGFVKLLLYW